MAWFSFKQSLLNIMDKHIPKIKVGGVPQPSSFHLSLLFLNSYNGGQLPPRWKSAIVFPVHKRGSKCDAENYRPISLTYIVSKVMERVFNHELILRCEFLYAWNFILMLIIVNKSCTIENRDKVAQKVGK